MSHERRNLVAAGAIGVALGCLGTIAYNLKPGEETRTPPDKPRTAEVRRAEPRLDYQIRVQPDTLTGKFVPESVHLLADYHEPANPAEEDDSWDMVCIGSLITDPRPNPGDTCETEIRDGRPGIEVFMTRSFAQKYDTNPDLRKQVAETIHVPEDYRVLTPEQEQLVREYGPTILLPFPHFAEAPRGYFLQYLPDIFSRARDGQRRALEEKFPPQ